ncbi:hypothetical protein [uncultured Vibrio sp.]|uniref:hypothetical protein n=1 Tax=uncultured Vibrio sp. TaxID=114054 RepID=UPI00260AEC9A|nr:hypothetical protein [uncultured Vibrio sp.]
MTQDELMIEARLATPTTQVYIYDSLMTLLKRHEHHVREKETLIHVLHLENGGYRVRYELPTTLITKRTKALYKEYILNPPEPE